MLPMLMTLLEERRRDGGRHVVGEGVVDRSVDDAGVGAGDAAVQARKEPAASVAERCDAVAVLDHARHDANGTAVTAPHTLSRRPVSKSLPVPRMSERAGEEEGVTESKGAPSPSKKGSGTQTTTGIAVCVELAALVYEDINSRRLLREGGRGTAGRGRGSTCEADGESGRCLKEKRSVDQGAVALVSRGNASERAAPRARLRCWRRGELAAARRRSKQRGSPTMPHK